MTAAVVARSLADRRRGVISYGVGLAAMVIWVMAIYPSVEKELADYMQAMPEAMRSMFGIQSISSLSDFVYAEVFSLMGPLVFIALAVTTGASTVAGEERDRILPIVLSTGVGRRSLLLSKLAALAVDLLAVGLITFASLLVGSLVAGGGLGVVGAAAACLQLTALGLLFGAMALTIGAATGHKALAAGVASGVAIAAYLVDTLGGLVSWLDKFKMASPFHWFAPGNPLIEGLSVGGLAALLGVTIALAALGAVLFDRRDIGV